VFAKFFFYFTGFNAIYFLWRKIDHLGPHDEVEHIANLIKKFGEVKTQEILRNVIPSVNYFCQRRPIQRMDRRPAANLSRREREGRDYQSNLKNVDLSALERIIALGGILYLVRSNLVHGSKAELGGDKEIIQMSIEPLKILLEEAISLTEKCFRQGNL
jgi:hypothetical protein